MEKEETKEAARAWAAGKQAARVSKEVVGRVANLGTRPATARKERAREAEVTDPKEEKED